MRMKKPYIAVLNQVKISREGEYAIIEYVEPNVSTTSLKLGLEVHRMTDQEILDCHNQALRVQQQMALEYEHVAVEIPLVGLKSSIFMLAISGLHAETLCAA